MLLVGIICLIVLQLLMHVIELLRLGSTALLLDTSSDLSNQSRGYNLLKVHAELCGSTQ